MKKNVVEIVQQTQQILRVEDLSVNFNESETDFDCVVNAVSNVTFGVEHDHILGIIGESGCGKTTIARAISGLQKSYSGRILFEQQSIVELQKNGNKELLKSIRMIFQNPESSLNPYIRVKNILKEACLIRENITRQEADERILEIVGKVSLDPGKLKCYPHNLSGGEKRRVMIARALFGKPKLIIGDEPLSSLDPITQSIIIDLFLELKKQNHFSMILISHDIKNIAALCDDVVVIHNGRIVEAGRKDCIFNEKREHHPYTIALSQAAKLLNIHKFSRRSQIKTQIQGCSFIDQCELYKQNGEPCACRDSAPVMQEDDLKDHRIACHLLGEGK